MKGILGRKLINLCFTNWKRSIPISPSTLYPQQQQDEEEDDQYFSTTFAASDHNIATILSSQRFFVSYPGLSRSIMDSNDSSLKPMELPDYPYMDFRRSMEEVVEAGNLYDVTSKSNWEYLHELLLCYLVLNPKTAHKFIHLAFSDLLYTLAHSSSIIGNKNNNVFS